MVFEKIKVQLNCKTKFTTKSNPLQSANWNVLIMFNITLIDSNKVK